MNSGLEPKQQEYYAGKQVVAAVPVRQYDDGNVVGVLSVISDVNDGAYGIPPDGINEQGIELLASLADKIGEVLSYA